MRNDTACVQWYSLCVEWYSCAEWYSLCVEWYSLCTVIQPVCRVIVCVQRYRLCIDTDCSDTASVCKVIQHACRVIPHMCRVIEHVCRVLVICQIWKNYGTSTFFFSGKRSSRSSIKVLYFSRMSQKKKTPNRRRSKNVTASFQLEESVLSPHISPVKPGIYTFGIYAYLSTC